jgi:hypothetical protein
MDLFRKPSSVAHAGQNLFIVGRSSFFDYFPLFCERRLFYAPTLFLPDNLVVVLASFCSVTSPSL